jgi:dihydrodipicolinate synthase/N-acetylneuraminate lyase
MKPGKQETLVTEVCNILKNGSNIAYFKAGLTMRGINAGHMRKPLLDLGEKKKEILEKQLAKFI